MYIFGLLQYTIFELFHVSLEKMSYMNVCVCVFDTCVKMLCNIFQAIER